MTPFGVVEHLYVVEHICPSLFTNCVYSPLDPLTFQWLEEAFCHGVVIAVSATAHVADQVVRLEEILPASAVCAKLPSATH